MESRYSLRNRYGDNGGSVKSRILAREGSTRSAPSEASKAKRTQQAADSRAFRNAEGVKARMSKFSSGASSSPIVNGVSTRTERNSSVRTEKSGTDSRQDNDRRTRSDRLKRYEPDLDDVNNNDIIKSPVSKGSKYSSEIRSIKSVSNGDVTKRVETKTVRKEWTEEDTKVSLVESSIETTFEQEVCSERNGVVKKEDTLKESDKEAPLSADTKCINMPQGGSNESALELETDSQSLDFSDAIKIVASSKDQPLTQMKASTDQFPEDVSTDDVISDELNGDVTSGFTSPTSPDDGDLVSAFAAKLAGSGQDSENNKPLRPPADEANEENRTALLAEESARNKRTQRHSNNKLIPDNEVSKNVEKDAMESKKDCLEEKKTRSDLRLTKLGGSEWRGNSEASGSGRHRRQARNSENSSKSSTSGSLASTPDAEAKTPVLESSKIESGSTAHTPESPVGSIASATSHSPAGEPSRRLVNDSEEIPTTPEATSHVTDDEVRDQVEEKKDFADVTDVVRADNKTKVKEEFDIKAEPSLLKSDNYSPTKATRTKSSCSESSKGEKATGTTGEVTENQSESTTTEDKAIEAATEVTSSKPSSEMRYTLDNLEQCTEEAILQKLLEEADKYEDRKKIRSALRALKRAQTDGIACTPKHDSSKWQTRVTTTAKTDKNNSRITKTTITTKTEYNETTTPPSKWQSRINSPPSGDKAPSDPKSLAEKYGLKSRSKPDMTSGSKKIGSIFDREEEAPKKSSGRLDIERRQAERRKEITRNRSMPSASSKDARKMFVAKLEEEGGGSKASKKVGKSPSFVVPNANNIKQMLLKWCQAKTRGYKHVDINNYSSSWADGMAFCALVHNFFPDAFDYAELDPKNRAQNFDLAFKMAESRGEIPSLLDVEDMVRMEEPDWKCVYTYITEFYKRIRELGF